MLRTIPFSQLENDPFLVVSQLNHGIDLLHSLEERKQLLHLNMTAARKAKQVNAYDMAVALATVGVQLLELLLSQDKSTTDSKDRCAM